MIKKVVKPSFLPGDKVMLICSKTQKRTISKTHKEMDRAIYYHNIRTTKHIQTKTRQGQHATEDVGKCWKTQNIQ